MPQVKSNLLTEELLRGELSSLKIYVALLIGEAIELEAENAALKEELMQHEALIN